MTAQIKVEIGGHPTAVEERMTGQLFVRSDPTIESSVAIDVWHDDPREFVQAYAQEGHYPNIVHVEAPDANRVVSMFSVQSGPVRIVHWDATTYATVDAFEAAWGDRVIDG